MKAASNGKRDAFHTLPSAGSSMMPLRDRSTVSKDEHEPISGGSRTIWLSWRSKICG